MDLCWAALSLPQGHDPSSRGFTVRKFDRVRKMNARSGARALLTTWGLADDSRAVLSSACSCPFGRFRFAVYARDVSRSSSALSSSAVQRLGGGAVACAVASATGLATVRLVIHASRAAHTIAVTCAAALPHPIVHRCDHPHANVCFAPGGTSSGFARATPIKPRERACVIARWTVRTLHRAHSAIRLRKTQQSRKLAICPMIQARSAGIPASRARSNARRASCAAGPSHGCPVEGPGGSVAWVRTTGTLHRATVASVHPELGRETSASSLASRSDLA